MSVELFPVPLLVLLLAAWEKIGRNFFVWPCVAVVWRGGKEWLQSLYQLSSGICWDFLSLTACLSQESLLAFFISFLVKVLAKSFNGTTLSHSVQNRSSVLFCPSNKKMIVDVYKRGSYICHVPTITMHANISNKSCACIFRPSICNNNYECYLTLLPEGLF